MGSDIERRPAHDLEITRVDPLLRDGHTSMSFSQEPDFRGTYELQRKNETCFISVSPHYVRVVIKSKGITVDEQFQDELTDQTDFFASKTEIYEGGSQKILRGTVGIKNGAECVLENKDNQIQIGIYRLTEIRNLVARSLQSKTAVVPMTKAA